MRNPFQDEKWPLKASKLDKGNITSMTDGQNINKILNFVCHVWCDVMLIFSLTKGSCLKKCSFNRKLQQGKVKHTNCFDPQKHGGTLVCHLLHILSLWRTAVQITARERVIYKYYIHPCAFLAATTLLPHYYYHPVHKYRYWSKVTLFIYLVRNLLSV